MFFIDEAGKIENMVQYSSIPATNEFGKTSGGKYIESKPGSDVDGRALQFSNRGEVAAVENFAKAYNAMDVQGVVAILLPNIQNAGHAPSPAANLALVSI